MQSKTHKCWKCQKPVIDDSVICGFCGVHQRIGNRYQPVKLLGEGQFGIVYKAYNVDVFGEPPTDAKDYFAVKVFKNPTADQKTIRNELQLLHNLPIGNSNIVRVSDDACREYIAMEFIDGINLHSLVRRASDKSQPEKQKDAAEALKRIRANFDSFLNGICHGLSGIHNIGMIHRDLKPKNILVTTEGLQPKIVDMGLAKLTTASHATSQVGSLEVMAPEVLNGPVGTAYDKRIDIWALGVVIYFLWSGVYPFGNQIASGGVKDQDWVDYNQLIAHIRLENPESVLMHNNKVPAYVAELLPELLKKDPRARLASAEAVVNRIGEVPYESAKAPNTYKLAEYQKQLSKIYAASNAPLPAENLLGHTIAQVGYLYNANKSGGLEALGDASAKHLPRVFAWLCALTESAGWNIIDVIPFKYNNECPYCRQPKCNMEHPIANEVINQKLLERLLQERRTEHVHTAGTDEEKPHYDAWTFADFANMFKRIYGEHNSKLEPRQILDHFHSEVDEFFAAMFHATAHRDPEATAIMFLELADLFAWFFAIHNVVEGEDSWFEKAFWDTYKDCPSCRHIPCSCERPDSQLSLSNWRMQAGILGTSDTTAVSNDAQ